MTITHAIETTQQLNHIEMVYRPGERHLATRVFELLGMRVIDNGGEWLFALVDPSVGDARNNVCYASEMTPQQWTLEQSLTSAMALGDSEVGAAAQVYADTVRGEPQHSFHFGIRYHEREIFDATLDRFRAADDDPDLAGRATLLGLYDPSGTRGVRAGHVPGLRSDRRGRRGPARTRPAHRAAVAPAPGHIVTAPTSHVPTPTAVSQLTTKRDSPSKTLDADNSHESEV